MVLPIHILLTNAYKVIPNTFHLVLVQNITTIEDVGRLIHGIVELFVR